MPMTARAAYPVCAVSYDDAPNPVLALEARLVSPRMPRLAGKTMIDVAGGTGRWAKLAASHGARAVVLDLCREMLIRSNHPSVLAEMEAIPLRDNAADLAICSLAIGYVRSAKPIFREMARIAHRVIVSDLHPDAVRAGWTRSFSAGDRQIEIEQHRHDLCEFEVAAREAGLRREWFVEAPFGPEEHSAFEAAGRDDLYERTRGINAVFASGWVRL